jgi:lipopolysaccharide biosynthesis glycosyltransferase
MKNLLYFCVFYNNNYFKLLNLLLTSLRFFSKIDSFDILILTNENMRAEVEELSRKLRINIKIQTFDFKTIFQAACARLFIFDYPEINNYEKLLYIDTDIIIKQDLSIFFDLQINNLLYALEQGTINSLNFGKQFFNFDNINPNTAGINSGTLLFKNCQEIRNLFSRMIGHINAYTDSKLTIPYTMDQPFINYHAISSEMYDNDLLNPYISLYEDTDNVNNYDTSIICHFSYPIGNFNHKYDRMKSFLIKILEDNTNKTFNLENINNKKYSWHTGYILFKNDSLLTAWTPGTFKALDDNKYLVSWAGFNHIIRMNEDNTEYISVRPSDFDIVFGKLIQ